MDSFQKIVLFSAIIILIFALVFIGVSLRYSDNVNWPPMVPSCPDYWTMDSSGNCINTKHLGTCRPPKGQTMLKINFDVPAFSGANHLCAKYNWAKKCNIAWDGLTYGAANPCQTKTSV